VKRLLFILLAVVLALSVGIIGCTTPAQQEEEEEPPPEGPTYGGTLKVGESLEGSGGGIGYPQKMTVTNNARYAAPAIESLFRVDEQGELVPWLASGYESNPTENTITITLREGIEFHDGTNFNAEAVKWNLEQAILCLTSGSSNIKSVEVLDDYTVLISLNTWDSTTITGLASFLGMMISPTAFETYGEDYCTENPIGTGPFKFVSWQRNVLIKYERNETYWQPDKPYLDAIEIHIIADPVTTVMSFKAGEIDAITLFGGPDSNQLLNEGYGFSRQNQGSGVLSIIPDSAVEGSPGANLLVRQAIAHAIDLQAIVNTVRYGAAITTNQWIYPGHWAYNPEVKGYPYDPDKARQLLIDAGYPDGFTAQLTYIQLGTEQDWIAVQSYLEDVGITLILNPLFPPAYVQARIGLQPYEGWINGAPSGDPDVVAQLKVRCSGDWYANMLVPDDYLEAINNAVAANDFESKKYWTHEVMRLMIDVYCLQIPMFSEPEYCFYQSYVHDIGISIVPNNAMWTPEDAWLD